MPILRNNILTIDIINAILNPSKIIGIKLIGIKLIRIKIVGISKSYI